MIVRTSLWVGDDLQSAGLYPPHALRTRDSTGCAIPPHTVQPIYGMMLFWIPGRCEDLLRRAEDLSHMRTSITLTRLSRAERLGGDHLRRGDSAGTSHEHDLHVEDCNDLICVCVRYK